ncbi:MAG: 1,4-alpha-glucan branching protein [Chitinophagaceae bacterium]|nr:1,4-alpha-glucan branching protein [Chitinophagaceae bacterium]
MENRFKTAEWAKGANIYEVNVRQYTTEGTFNAFAKHLPRLRQMGVEVIWFIPITPISNQKRLGTLGSYYSTSNYTTINPEFGTLDDFKSTVQQAHELGMKVLIDWVANHTGWDHHWTVEHPEYYKKNAEGNFFDNHGWNDVIDLDYSNENLRLEMIKAMTYWIKETGIDGFRCDMAHLVPIDFWTRARTEISKIKKDLFWLAETEDVIYNLAFDAMYAWELLHTMEKLYKGEVIVEQLEKILEKYSERFPEDAIHLAFTSNHDENSHSGTEYERMGNAAKAFAVLTATWKNCMPLVYSGQELPNQKRLLFFDKDEIEWTGTNWLHDFYKSLLDLHRSNPALHTSTKGKTTRLLTDTNDTVFAFTRQLAGNQVLVLLNLSSQKIIKVNIDDASIKGHYKSAFSGFDYTFSGKETFELNSWGYLVYYKVN